MWRVVLLGILYCGSAVADSFFECNAQQTCNGQTLNCEAGGHCLLVCVGASACQSTHLNCGSSSTCEVRCTVSGSCSNDVTITRQSQSWALVTCLAGACTGGKFVVHGCTTSSCFLDCSADSNVCENVDKTRISPCWWAECLPRSPQRHGFVCDGTRLPSCQTPSSDNPLACFHDITSMCLVHSRTFNIGELSHSSARQFCTSMGASIVESNMDLACETLPVGTFVWAPGSTTTPRRVERYQLGSNCEYQQHTATDAKSHFVCAFVDLTSTGTGPVSGNWVVKTHYGRHSFALQPVVFNVQGLLYKDPDDFFRGPWERSGQSVDGDRADTGFERPNAITMATLLDSASQTFAQYAAHDMWCELGSGTCPGWPNHGIKTNSCPTICDSQIDLEHTVTSLVGCTAFGQCSGPDTASAIRTIHDTGSNEGGQVAAGMNSCCGSSSDCLNYSPTTGQGVFASHKTASMPENNGFVLGNIPSTDGRCFQHEFKKMDGIDKFVFVGQEGTGAPNSIILPWGQAGSSVEICHLANDGLCREYTDCGACVLDPLCGWLPHTDVNGAWNGTCLGVKEDYATYQTTKTERPDLWSTTACPASDCESLTTCTACIAEPSCGWCSDSDMCTAGSTFHLNRALFVWQEVSLQPFTCQRWHADSCATPPKAFFTSMQVPPVFTEDFASSALSGWAAYDSGGETANLGPSSWSSKNSALLQDSLIYVGSGDQVEGSSFVYSPGGIWVSYTLDAQIRSNSGGQLGWQFRRTSPTSYYEFTWADQVTFNDCDGPSYVGMRGRRLRKRGASGFVTLAEDDFGLSSDTVHTLKIVVLEKKSWRLDEGTQILVMVDGFHLWTINDDAVERPRYGTVAASVARNDHATFNSIAVTPVCMPPLTTSNPYIFGPYAGPLFNIFCQAAPPSPYYTYWKHLAIIFDGNSAFDVDEMNLLEGNYLYDLPAEPTRHSARDAPLTEYYGDTTAFCTPAAPCGQCGGDCDTDDDCLEGFLCFQRQGMDVPVPGCSHTGLLEHWDYCYDPAMHNGWPKGATQLHLVMEWTPAVRAEMKYLIVDNHDSAQFDTPFYVYSRAVVPVELPADGLVDMWFGVAFVTKTFDGNYPGVRVGIRLNSPCVGCRMTVGQSMVEQPTTSKPGSDANGFEWFDADLATGPDLYYDQRNYDVEANSVLHISVFLVTTTANSNAALLARDLYVQVDVGLPLITHIWPTSTNTVGGTQHTITGKNFGSEWGGVLIGEDNVEIVDWGPDSILFRSNPGVGIPLVTVQRTDFVASTWGPPLSYNSLTVTGIGPSDSQPTAGIKYISIFGRSFGTDLASVKVTIGSFPCVVTAVDHAHIQCVLGAGAGKQLVVAVTIRGVTDSSQTLSFRGPTLDDLTLTSIPTTGYNFSLTGRDLFTDPLLGQPLTPAAAAYAVTSHVSITHGANSVACQPHWGPPTYIHPNTEHCVSTPCGRCEGDCDSDAECQPGLLCYMRVGLADPVPGCRSAGMLPEYDYCYDPADVPVPTDPPTAAPTNQQTYACDTSSWDKDQGCGSCKARKANVNTYRTCTHYCAMQGAGECLHAQLGQGTCAGGDMVSCDTDFPSLYPTYHMICGCAGLSPAMQACQPDATGYEVIDVCEVTSSFCALTVQTQSDTCNDYCTSHGLVCINGYDDNDSHSCYDGARANDYRRIGNGCGMTRLHQLCQCVDEPAPTPAPTTTAPTAPVTDTYTCFAPPGTTSGNELRIHVFGQTSAVQLFDYDGPELWAIEPTSGREGDTVIIRGKGFGPVTSSSLTSMTASLYDAATSLIEEIQLTVHVDDATLQGIIPSGVGNVQLQLVRRKVDATSTLNGDVMFQYLVPTVSLASPLDGRTDEQGILTLDGEGFGTSGSQTTLSVYVGNNECTLLTRQNARVTCRIPVGQGTTQSISFLWAGTRIDTSYLFDYAPPDVLRIIPSIGSPGETVLIEGTNFGVLLAGVGRVFIGNLQCYTSSTDYNHTHIACTLPGGSGTDLRVLVEVSDQASDPNTLFRYTGVQISSFAPLTGPTEGSSNGDTVMTITGSGFYAGVVVTIGPGMCEITSLAYNTIACKLPAGEGERNLVTVVAPDNRTASAPEFFTYDLPWVQILAPQRQSVGGLVQLTGANFGTGLGTYEVYLLRNCGRTRPSDFIGCYVDDNFRDLHEGPRNYYYGVESCSAACREFPFFALQHGGYCSCAFDYGTPANEYPPAPAEECATLVCPYGPGTHCGGGWRNAIYPTNPAECVTTMQSMGIVHVNHNNVNMTMPPGVGRANHLVFRIATGTGINQTWQSSWLRTTVFIDYLPPTIESVGGCVDVLNATIDCAVDGTERLTITGEHFGPAGHSEAAVTVGELRCESLLVISETEIQCDVPARPTGGYNLDVRVSVGGQDVFRPFLSYYGPKISAIAIATGSPYACSSTAPTSLLNAGGELLCFSSEALGSNLSAVEVEYGRSDTDEWLVCNMEHVNGTTGFCATAPGLGRDLQFRLSVGLLSSRLSAVVVNYAQPVILPGTIRLQLTATGASSINGTSTRGEDVFFDVQNMPTQQAVLGAYVHVAMSKDLVPYASLGANDVCTEATPCGVCEGDCDRPSQCASGLTCFQRTGFADPVPGCAETGMAASWDYCHDPGAILACKPVKVFSVGGDGGQYVFDTGSPTTVVIKCRTAASVGVGWKFRITGLGADSGLGSDSYSYKVNPYYVTSITGCSTSGPSTVDCPTTGGVQLTLDGYFCDVAQACPVVILLGQRANLRCENVVPIADTQVTCTLPPGSGSVSVLVANGADISPLNEVSLSYREAEVRGLTSSACVATDATHLIACPIQARIPAARRRLLGVGSLTITGQNFGPEGARVMIGTQPCLNVVHTPGKEHEELTCDLPSPLGNAHTSDLLVGLLLLNDHLRVFDHVRLSYAQCPAGERRPQFDASGVTPMDTACVGCVAGRASTEGSTECFVCPLGREAPPSSPSCELCRKGYFRSDATSTQCTACAPGKFSAMPGKEACDVCEAGTFASASGSSRCELCQPGRATGQEGQSDCSLCSAGRFADKAGSVVCSACPEGSVTAIDGLATCQTCETGKVASIPGQSLCQPCSEGFSSAGAALCAICPSGRFGNATALGECHACAPGSYSRVTPSSTKGNTECTRCLPGRHAPQSTSSQCVVCPLGKYTPGLGYATCVECPPGRFNKGEYGAVEECLPCPVGTHSRSGAAVCSNCELGRFANVTGQPDCTPCAPGSSATTNAIECQPCLAGRSQSLEGNSDCVVCESGKVASGEGMVDCEFCPAGHYPDGATGCIISDPGFSVASGASYQSPCREGTYANTSGLTACRTCEPGRAGVPPPRVDCVSCLPGFFTAIAGETSCKLCGAGSYSATPGTGVCTQCALGTYQPAQGRQVCIQCPGGKSTTLTGQSKCETCTPGRFSTLNDTSCLVCPPGRVQPDFERTSCVPCTVGYSMESEAQAQCLACVPGRFSNASAAEVCDECPPGWFVGTSGATACRECDRATYAMLGGSEQCQSCGLGRYGIEPRQSSCLACPPGRFADSLRSTACKPCEPGTFADKPGGYRCLPCAPGTIQPGSANASCVPCPPGQFQATVGQTACGPCAPGTYTPLQGTLTCFACPVGSYLNASGGLECMPCGVGHYQDVVGQTGCRPCKVGEYARVMGRETCDLCPAGTYTTNESNVECTECAPGFFQDEEGANGCKLCPIGRARDVPRGETCPACVKAVAPQEGMLQCTDCKVPTIADFEGLHCECDVGWFSDGYPDTFAACKECPVGANCEIQGTQYDKLGAKAGYWRRTNTSLVFHRCGLLSHCQGGHLSRCAPYRGGPLCAVCSLRTEQDGSGQCVPCAPRSESEAVMSVVGILIVGGLCLLFFLLLTADRDLIAKTKSQFAARRQGGGEDSFRDSISADELDEAESTGSSKSEATLVEPVTKAPVTPASGAVRIVDTHRPNFSFKLKIFLGFFQLITLMLASYEVPWPQEYKIVMHGFKIVNLDFLSWGSLECLGTIGFYTRVLWTAMLPLLVLAAVGLFYWLPWRLYLLYRRASSAETMVLAAKVLKIVVFVLYVVYPTLCSSLFRMLHCKQVGDTLYVAADMRFECGTPEWQANLPFVIIGILIAPIGLPVLFFVLVYINRHKFELPAVRLVLGLLFDGYGATVWWWDTVEMLEKCVLTSLLLFIPPSVRMHIGMAVVGSTILLQLWVVPYARKGDRRLSLLAQSDVLSLLLAGLLLSDNQTQFWAGPGLFLVTIVFVAVFVFQTFKIFYKKTLRPMVAKRGHKAALRAQASEAEVGGGVLEF